MATAHVQSKGAIANAVTSLNITVASTGAGNHLAAMIVAFHNASDPVLLLPNAPAGTWLNAIAEQHLIVGASDWEAYRVDYKENISSGSTTVTVRCTNASDVTGVVREASGVATSSSIGNTNTNSTTVAGTTLTTGSINPTTGSFLDIWTVPDKTAADSGASTADTGGQSSNFTVPIAGGAGTVWDDASNVPGGNGYFANCSNSATNVTWTAPTSCTRQMAAITEFLAPASGGPVIQMMTVGDQSMVGSAI